MNMFARFDENPAMTLEDIKETKHYGRTDRRTDTRTHGRENSIPTTKVADPAMTLEDIKETKRYGRRDGQTHAHTDNVKTVYPPQTKFAGGIKTHVLSA